jgi:cytochrome P450
MIYFLSLDQKMQEDVRSEVLELSAQGFNSDTLKKYFKLSALINETLRLQVLGEGSFPREVMHDTQINEFHLKKGYLQILKLGGT